MAKAPISPEKKFIARHALALFGGKPKVQEYLHDDIDLSIDILSVVDSPEQGTTAYSTLGLFETILGSGDKELPTGVELCGAMPPDVEHWGNILAGASFALMRTKQVVIPGSVLEGYVAEYYPHTTVPHLYLTAPFFWNDGHFQELTLDTGRTVN